MKEIQAYLSKNGKLYQSQSKAMKEDLSEEMDVFCKDLQRTFEGSPWIKDTIVRVFLAPDFDLKRFSAQIRQWRKLKQASEALQLAETTLTTLNTPDEEEERDEGATEGDIPS